MDQKFMTSLLEKNLRAIYEAEHQILEGLHLMSAQSFSAELQKAFQRHEKETRHQIKRLDEVADNFLIDLKKEGISKMQKALGKGKEIIKDIVHAGSPTKNNVILSLIQDSKELLERFHNMDPEIIDIALAGDGTQIEQAEIAAYQILCYLAEKLDEPESLELLQQNLEEEKQALFILTEITEQELTKKPSKSSRKMTASR